MSSPNQHSNPAHADRSPSFPTPPNTSPTPTPKKDFIKSPGLSDENDVPIAKSTQYRKWRAAQDSTESKESSGSDDSPIVSSREHSRWKAAQSEGTDEGEQGHLDAETLPQGAIPIFIHDSITGKKIMRGYEEGLSDEDDGPIATSSEYMKWKAAKSKSTRKGQHERLDSEAFPNLSNPIFIHDSITGEKVVCGHEALPVATSPGLAEQALDATPYPPSKQALDDTLASKLSVPITSSESKKEALDRILASKLQPPLDTGYSYSQSQPPPKQQRGRNRAPTQWEQNTQDSASLPPKNFMNEPFLPDFLPRDGTDHATTETVNGALVADLFATLHSHGHDIPLHLTVPPASPFGLRHASTIERLRDAPFSPGIFFSSSTVSNTDIPTRDLFAAADTSNFSGGNIFASLRAQGKIVGSAEDVDALRKRLDKESMDWEVRKTAVRHTHTKTKAPPKKKAKKAKDVVEEEEGVEGEGEETAQTKAPSKKKGKKQKVANEAAEDEVPAVATHPPSQVPTVVTQPPTEDQDVSVVATQPPSQDDEVFRGCAKLLERLNENALLKGLRLSELNEEERVCRRLVERLNEKAFQRGLKLSLLGPDEEEETDDTSQQRTGIGTQQEDVEMSGTSAEVANGQGGNGASAQSVAVQIEGEPVRPWEL
jgi:hypothetical protein